MDGLQRSRPVGFACIGAGFCREFSSFQILNGAVLLESLLYLDGPGAWVFRLKSGRGLVKGGPPILELRLFSGLRLRVCSVWKTDAGHTIGVRMNSFRPGKPTVVASTINFFRPSICAVGVLERGQSSVPISATERDVGASSVVGLGVA